MANRWNNAASPDLRCLLTLAGPDPIHWHDLAHLHQLIQAGIPTAVADSLERFLELDAGQAANIVGVRRASRGRYQKTSDGRLPAVASDRVVRATRVVADALEVFGREDKVQRWLTTSVQALDGQVPCDYLTTEAGVEWVRDELNRIKYGMWA